MNKDSNTITEFLEARIAEDDQLARHLNLLGDPLDNRMVAECAAKRATIAEHEPADYSKLEMESPNACSRCGVYLGMGEWDWIEDSYPCKTLRSIAAIYSDHEDYRQEWAV